MGCAPSHSPISKIQPKRVKHKVELIVSSSPIPVVARCLAGRSSLESWHVPPGLTTHHLAKLPIDNRHSSEISCHSVSETNQIRYVRSFFLLFRFNGSPVPVGCSMVVQLWFGNQYSIINSIIRYVHILPRPPVSWNLRHFLIYMLLFSKVSISRIRI